MSLLDVLGTGAGLWGQGLARQQLAQQHGQPMSGNYPLHIQYVCKHFNCPICEDNRVRLLNEQRKKDWETAQKKEAYEKRCKEYMDRLHRIKI